MSREWEMTRLPDCPTCGRTRWQTAVCTCGHAVTVHNLSSGTTRKRAACSVASGPFGTPCGCRQFTGAPKETP